MKYAMRRGVGDFNNIYPQMPPPMPHLSRAYPPVMPAAPPMKFGAAIDADPAGAGVGTPNVWVHDQTIVPPPAATEVIV